MNLTKLFELQRELDARIEQEHPTQPGEDRLAKKILALQVELGECANEWRGFKFWSKDQTPCTNRNEHDFFSDDVIRTYNPLLEEYVDCLHFILSIGLEISYTNPNRENLHEELEDAMESFQHVFNWCASLQFALDQGLTVTNKAYERLVDVFLALGYHLGFKVNEIEEAYSDKNAINLQRQANGY